VVILEQGNDLEARMEGLITELENSLKKGDSKNTASVGEKLKEVQSSLASSTFLKVMEVLDNSGSYNSVEQSVSVVERVIESEKNLFTSIAATYTESFKINEEFIKYHKEYLQRLEEGLGSELSKVKQELKSRLELRIKVALGDKDAQSKLDSSSDEDFNKFGEFAKEWRERELYCGNPYFPNLKPGSDSNSLSGRVSRSKINQGSQFYAFNPEDTKSRAFEDIDISKVKISLDQDVEQIFANAAHIFKSKKSFEFSQFYGENWREDTRLPGFNVSAPELENLLSGFIFTEPWMINLFIYYEERWRVNDHLKESFGKMYGNDPVLFCVKLNTGENAFLSVKRKGEQEWKISKVTGTVNTHRFLTPQIASGY
jgi:hypothetical protein